MQIEEEEDKLFANALAVSYVQDGLPMVPHLSFTDEEHDIVRCQNEVSLFSSASSHCYFVLSGSYSRGKIHICVFQKNLCLNNYFFIVFPVNKKDRTWLNWAVRLSLFCEVKPCKFEYRFSDARKYFA